MAAITYEVTIGALCASNHAQQGDPLLLSLTTELAMDGDGGGSRCLVELSAPEEAAPPKPGDPTSVTLESDGLTTVFTGWVHEVKAAEGTLAITAVDRLPRLAPLNTDGAHHTFSYRTEVIAIDLAQVPPAHDRRVVRGWPRQGFVDVLGKPAVSPGDLVKIDGIPAAHPAGPRAAGAALRVRRVRHTLAPRQGFVTRLEF